MVNRKTGAVSFFFKWDMSPKGKLSVDKTFYRIKTDNCHSTGTECDRGSDVYKKYIKASEQAILFDDDLILQEFPVFERDFPIDSMSIDALNVCNDLLTDFDEGNEVSLMDTYNASDRDELCDAMRNALDTGSGLTIIFLDDDNGNVVYG